MYLQSTWSAQTDAKYAIDNYNCQCYEQNYHRITWIPSTVVSIKMAGSYSNCSLATNV